MNLRDAIAQWELSIQAGGPGSGRWERIARQQKGDYGRTSGWDRIAQNERDSRAADKEGAYQPTAGLKRHIAEMQKSRGGDASEVDAGGKKCECCGQVKPYKGEAND